MPKVSYRSLSDALDETDDPDSVLDARYSGNFKPQKYNVFVRRNTDALGGTWKKVQGPVRLSTANNTACLYHENDINYGLCPWDIRVLKVGEKP